MSTSSPPEPLPRRISRLLAATFFTLAGLNHFLHPSIYTRLIPPYLLSPTLPSPQTYVLLSALPEIAGALALLVPRLRPFARWTLIALLITVFPANLHMALHPDLFPDFPLPPWTLWARLPLQPVLICWVWSVSGRKKPPV